jgi:putative copper export protein
MVACPLSIGPASLRTHGSRNVFCLRFPTPMSQPAPVSRRLISPLWVVAAVLFATAMIVSVIAFVDGTTTTIEDLLLDEFPRHRAPAGMAALTTLSYVGMLVAVGVPYFRILVPGFTNDWSIRVTYAASAMATGAMVLLVPVTKAFEEERDTILAIFEPAMWDVHAGHGTVRALIFTGSGLAFMLFFLERGIGRRVNRLAALGGGLLALGAFTVVGHTATLEPAAIIHGADFVHTLAAAFWLGGLIALAQYLWSALRRGHDTAEFHDPLDSARVIAKFSALALWSFAALATSGFAMGWIVAGNPLDIVGSTYLNLLMTKLGVLVVPLGMAVWNRFRLVPGVIDRPDDEQRWAYLRTAIVIEVVGILLILFITGYLVLQNPEA